MLTIIKHRKTGNYTQIDNIALQEDLTDLAAIGLLTYIMSHPEDWNLHKSQLQNYFTRRKVDSAWKVLIEQRYVIGFYCHVDGNQKYFYRVSDIPFTQNDFEAFIAEVKKTLEEKGNTVFNIKAIKDSTLSVPDFFSNIKNVQNNEDNSKSATTKETGTKETDRKKHSLTTVNKPTNNTDKIIEIANEFYTHFAPGRWAKETWHKVTEKYAREFIASNRQIPDTKLKAYVYGSLKKIAEHHDYKNSEDYAEYKRVMKEMFVENGVNKHEGITMPQ
ncbi:hypothetical protein [Oceanobacillus picturae]|uniref:hypothetical protein n=1 Tax=Oceanobacillus picturae TaxID=171693 RepID=UPI00362944BB